MATTLSNDIEHGPAEGQSMRNWIDALKDRHDLTAEEILFQTTDSDPCWIGTDLDHAKADWAASYYQRMIDGREGNEIHTRGMHYWLLSLDEDVVPVNVSGKDWDVYENTDACYEELKNCLSCARLLGKVPFHVVLDESSQVSVMEEPRNWSGSHRLQSEWDGWKRVEREIADLPTVSSPSDYIEASLEYESFDDAIEDFAEDIAKRVSGPVNINTRLLRPFYIEVWSEKKLPTEIVSVIENYPVGRFIQGSGHSGFHDVNEFVNNVEEANTPGYLMYLSDWDSAGEDMPASVSSKVEYFQQKRDIDHSITVDKMGITEEQVNQYSLPQNYEKDKPYVELNALEVDMGIFENIVRGGLERVTADMSEVEKHSKQERNRIESDIYRQVKDELMDREDELRPIYEDAEDMVEEYNRLIEERKEAYSEHVSEYDSEMRDLRRDEGLNEFKQIIRDVPSKLDYPAVTLPEVEATDEPSDPLYDSERPLIENSKRIND